MATITSQGIGSGLDIKSIVSQLVSVEKQPLNKLKLEATATQSKISAFGQIQSLVSALADAASALNSLTGWNGVFATSSDSASVSVSAIGGTQPTEFNVEVQSLAKAQATASMALLPVGGAIGAGTVRLEIGSWSGASFTAGSGTPVDLTISASDTVSDVASKINGANAGVTATVLTDASGERLLLRGKNTGIGAGFRLSVTSDADGNVADALGLSRVVNGSTVTQAASDAAATINGIAVTSATNTFANAVSGVTFTAVKQTAGPVAIAITKDASAVQKKIEAFVKAYNDINGVLNEAMKYDPATKAAGMLQGDAMTQSLQNALRSVVQSSTTASSVFGRLSDVGVSVLRGGNLEINSVKLSSAMSNMDELKKFFSSTGAGAAQGIAGRFKALTSAMLSAAGFFKNNQDSLQRDLDKNTKEQARVNDHAAKVEASLNRRYSALDTQMSSLNALNSYMTQQITQWNKSSN
ncbi:MAG: flagellar filament capping protein FliD [Hylemonella sp.]|nr:flagellar filament capping protein FliD [Hylemonella sp.]